MSRSFVLFQLRWLPGKDVPAFSTANSVEGLPVSIASSCAFHLEGDYLALDTVNNIFVWNWRAGTSCMIDPEHQEWVSSSGCRCERTDLEGYLMCRGTETDFT